MLKTTPDEVSYDERATDPHPSEKWKCFGVISDIVLINSTPVAKQKPRPLGQDSPFHAMLLRNGDWMLHKHCDMIYSAQSIYTLLLFNSINTFMVNQFISCSSSRARCHRLFNFMLALLIFLALCFHPKKGRERDGSLSLYCWAEQLAP